MLEKRKEKLRNPEDNYTIEIIENKGAENDSSDDEDNENDHENENSEPNDNKNKEKKNETLSRETEDIRADNDGSKEVKRLVTNINKKRSLEKRLSELEDPSKEINVYFSNLFT